MAVVNGIAYLGSISELQLWERRSSHGSDSVCMAKGGLCLPIHGALPVLFFYATR
jgi:hypothetical protein